jgi:hypothetical protein
MTALLNPPTREEWEKKISALMNPFLPKVSPSAKALDAVVSDILAIQSHLAEEQAKNRKLILLKEEWETLVSPLLDFGRKNSDALGLNIGDSILNVALSLMHEKVRKFKEREIESIFKKFKTIADASIFIHALSTYGGTGDLAKQVSNLSPEDFDTFYNDCKENWGEVNKGSLSEKREN